MGQAYFERTSSSPAIEMLGGLTARTTIRRTPEMSLLFASCSTLTRYALRLDIKRSAFRYENGRSRWSVASPPSALAIGGIC